MLRWILIFGVLSAHAAQIPRTFVVNRGQAPATARYASRDVLFGEHGFWTVDNAIRASFLSAAATRVEGQDRLPYTSKYLDLGSPDKPHRQAENYRQLIYRNLYPGIDLKWHLNGSNLEYDFVVRPGANPNLIAMELQVKGAVELAGNGDLVMKTADREMRERLPLIYQEGIGRVEGRFTLQRRRNGTAIVRFAIADYDHNKELTIDPVISYVSTVEIAANPVSAISGIAIDGAGNTVLVGSELAAGPSAMCSSPQCSDIFLATLDTSGTVIRMLRVIASTTFLSGPAIALDASGAIYLAGATGSSAIPTTPGAFQRELKGNNCPAPGSTMGVPCAAGYVVKINADGTIAYSTLLGGSGGDRIAAIRVDMDGNAWVTGTTRSADFPVTASAIQKTLGGVQDAFVAQVNPSGSDLTFSSYFGGSGNETAVDLALDAVGAVYLTGTTNSVDLPATSGALQPKLAGGTDVYFAKLTNGTIAWATYWGTPGADVSTALESGPGDSLYAAVQSPPQAGPPLPVTSVLKLNAETSQLISSFSGVAGVTRVKVDASGRVVMLGQVQSFNGPSFTANAIDACRRIGAPLLARLDSDGKSLLYESNADFGPLLAIDAAGNAYVAGGNSVEKIDFTVDPAHTISCIEPAGVFTASGVAPGQMVNLWGSGVGPAGANTASFDGSGSLPFALGGSRVLFNEIAAPLLFAAPNQVNAIVPLGLVGANSANVRIEAAGQKVAQGHVLIVPAGGQILNIVNQDGAANSMGHPAAAGEVVTIYASGGGQTEPPSIDGRIVSAPAPLVLPAEVILLSGSALQQTSAEVLYAGAAPGQVAGIVQVNVRLPDPLPAPQSPVVPVLSVALSIGHPNGIVATGQLFVK